MEIESHSALNIEFWGKVIFNGSEKLSFNHRVQYMGLKIEASKFYFFLKEKFGSPNVKYESISQYFPERIFSMGKDWCYVFKCDSNFIIVCGDDLVNIAILSIGQPPTKMDFDIFSSNVNRLLEKTSLKKHDNVRFDLFLNYSFYLKNIISEGKKVFGSNTFNPPELLSMDSTDANSEDPEVKYKYIENSRDFNQGLAKTLEKSTLALQIQILYPIYFESLVDLAFRIKLRASIHNLDRIHGDKEPKKDIFQHFEQLRLKEKIIELKDKCFHVNNKKADAFIDSIDKDKLRRDRNKLLHGNSIFFKNLNAQYYYDEGYLIGYPDRARGRKVIADCIQSSVDKNEILDFINKYEIRCDSFMDIFDDDNYFKELISGIAFGYNTRSGGAFSLSIKKYDDLFAPTQW